MAGQRWSPEEDVIVRQIYPDYTAMKAALTKRTKDAIAGRVKTLMLGTPARPWTGADIKRLRQARLDGISNDVIRQMFPERNWEAIYFQIKSFKIPRRRRRAASAFRHPVVESIRQILMERRLPIVRFSRQIGAPKHFARCDRSTSIENIIKAVHYLGGEIDIVWRDAEQ